MSSLVLLSSDKNELQEVNERLSKDGMRNDLTVEHKLRYVWRLYKRSENSLKSSLNDVTLLQKRQNQDLVEVENYISHIRQLSDQKKVLMSDCEKENDMLKDEVSQLQEEKRAFDLSLQKIQEFLSESGISMDCAEKNFSGQGVHTNDCKVAKENVKQCKISSFEESLNVEKKNLPVVSLDSILCRQVESKESLNIKKITSEMTDCKKIEELLASIDENCEASSSIKRLIESNSKLQKENSNLQKESQMISEIFENKCYTKYFEDKKDLPTFEKLELLEQLYQQQAEALKDMEINHEMELDTHKKLKEHEDHPYQVYTDFLSDLEEEKFDVVGNLSSSKFEIKSYKNAMQSCKDLSREKEIINEMLNQYSLDGSHRNLTTEQSDFDEPTTLTLMVDGVSFKDEDISLNIKGLLQSHKKLLNKYNQVRNETLKIDKLLQLHCSPKDNQVEMSLCDRLEIIQQYQNQSDELKIIKDREDKLNNILSDNDFKSSDSFPTKLDELLERYESIRDDLLRIETRNKAFGSVVENALHKNGTDIKRSHIENLGVLIKQHENKKQELDSIKGEQNRLKKLICQTIKLTNELNNFPVVVNSFVQKYKCLEQHLSKQDKEKCVIHESLNSMIPIQVCNNMHRLPHKEQQKSNEVLSDYSSNLTSKLEAVGVLYKQLQSELQDLKRERAAISEIINTVHHNTSPNNRKSLAEKVHSIVTAFQEQGKQLKIIIEKHKELDYVIVHLQDDRKPSSDLEDIDALIDELQLNLQASNKQIEEIVKLLHSPCISELYNDTPPAKQPLQKLQIVIVSYQNLGKELNSVKAELKWLRNAHKKLEKIIPAPFKRILAKTEEPVADLNMQAASSGTTMYRNSLNVESKLLNYSLNESFDSFISSYKKLEEDYNTLFEEYEHIKAMLENTEYEDAGLSPSSKLEIILENADKIKREFHKIEDSLDNANTIDFCNLSEGNDKDVESVCKLRSKTLAVLNYTKKLKIAMEVQDNVLKEANKELGAFHDLQSFHKEITNELEEKVLKCSELTKKLDQLENQVKSQEDDLKVAKKEREGVTMKLEDKVVECSKLTKKLEELENQVKSQENDLNKANKEQEAFHNLQNLHEGITKELEVKVVECSKLTKKLEELENQVKSQENDLNKANKEQEAFYNLQNLHEGITKELEDKVVECSKLTKKLKELENQVKSQENDLNKANKEQEAFHNLQNLHEGITKELQEKEVERPELIKMLEELEEKTSVRVDDLKTRENELREAKKELETFHNLQSLYNEVTSELEDKVLQCAELLKKLEEFELIVGAHKDDLKEANKELQAFHDLQRLYDGVTNELKDKVLECSELTKKFEEMENAVKTQENDLDKSLEDIQILQSVREGTRKELEKNEVECLELTKKLEDTIKAREDDLKTRKNDLQGAKKEVEDLQNLHVGITRELEDKVLECSDLSKKLKDLVKEQQKTSTLFDAMWQDYTILQEQHKIFKRKYQHKTDETVSISEELQEAESMLLKKKKEKIELMKKNNDLKSNMELLSSTIEDLRKELDSCKSKHKQEIENLENSHKDELCRTPEKQNGNIEDMYEKLEEKTRMLQMHNTTLEKENDSLRQKVDSICAAQKGILQVLELDHHKSIQALHSQHEGSAEEMRKNYENKDAQLNKQLELNEEEIESLRLQLKAANKKKKEIHRNLSVASGDAKFMKERINLLHEEKQKLESQLKVDKGMFTKFEKDAMKLSTSNKKLKEELCTVKDQLLRQKDSIHTLKMKIKKKNGEIKENETNFLQLEDSYQNQITHLQETNEIQEQVLVQLKLEMQSYHDMHGELLHKSHTEVSCFKQKAEVESKRTKEVEHQVSKVTTQYSELKNTLKAAVQELNQL